MRVKPENFHLLSKYGFSNGFDMEDHSYLKSEISTESYWAKINNHDNIMFIVINEQGVICAHHVKGEKSGYDIPLPDILVQMWKDGIIDTQFNSHNVLIEAAKAVFRDQIKVEEYLNQYVMKFDDRELANTFLYYILENNTYADSYIHARHKLHKKLDDQLVVYLLSDVDHIRYAYLANYSEVIEDLLKKHIDEDSMIITRLNDKNKEVVIYLKLNGEIAYKNL